MNSWYDIDDGYYRWCDGWAFLKRLSRVLCEVAILSSNDTTGTTSGGATSKEAKAKMEQLSKEFRTIVNLFKSEIDELTRRCKYADTNMLIHVIWTCPNHWQTYPILPTCSPILRYIWNLKRDRYPICCHYYIVHSFFGFYESDNIYDNILSDELKIAGSNHNYTIIISIHHFYSQFMYSIII